MQTKKSTDKLTEKLNCAVVGASGYAGLELIRLLLGHPGVRLQAIYSRQRSVEKFSELYPSLSTFCELELKPFAGELAQIDVVFVAVPHGESALVIKEILEKNQPAPVIIDLGADLRVSAQSFEEAFGTAHPAPELCARAVYGTPELDPHILKTANLIANPGCFAHTIILALAELVRAGVTDSHFRVAAMTGSSGGGAKPNQKAHHPERDGNITAYQVFKHRHLAEVSQTLTKLGQAPVEIEFVPLSGPYVRGIFATCFAELSQASVNVSALYQDFCADKRFLRLRAETPRMSEIKGSNFCDVAVQQRGSSVVVLASLDNLVKGAGGNAIQCMNIRFGLPEKCGLDFPAIFP